MSQWTSDINKISGLLRILLRKLLSCEIDIRATTPNFKWTPETADTRGPEPWIFLWLVSLQIIVVTPHDFVMNYLSWNTHFPPRLGWDDPDGPRSRTPGAPGTQYWKIAKWLIRWLILKYHDIMFVPFLHGLSLNLKCLLCFCWDQTKKFHDTNRLQVFRRDVTQVKFVQVNIVNG